MRARKATYVTSATAPAGFPPPGPPEIAFAGRSNVGKSSLINTLTGAPRLAKTSSTPGRTRMLNWFSVLPPSGPEIAFVDLPGYGYAKVPQDMRKAWRPLVEDFVTSRETLKLVCLLVDARRPPEHEEHELVEWLDSLGRRFLVVVTKGDKLTKSQQIPTLAEFRKTLGLKKDPLLFSAQTGEGVEPLWRVVATAVKS